MRCNGRAASTTKRWSWATFDEVRRSKVGNGVGIMLGDGIGCWDLDHCLVDDEIEPWAAEFLAMIKAPIWVERSMSRTGLHIFVHADEAPGYCHPPIEFYSRARFIAVTGDRFELS